MKRIEKMILICIWLCIAIVAVLIHDQLDLNQRIQENTQEIMDDSERYNKKEQIILDEMTVMEMIGAQVPEVKDASLMFKEDQIEVFMLMDDEFLEKVGKIVNHDLIASFLPLLKNSELSCQAKMSVDQIWIHGCKVGMFSVPDEILGVVEEKVNVVWKTIVTREKIEEVNVSESGLALTVHQE